MANNNIDKELKAAVDENDLGKVRSLLAAGANPNFVPSENISQHQEGNTLLHYATSADIVKELISHGAYVDAVNSYKETPLYTAITASYYCSLAIRYGRTTELVNELLKHSTYARATTRKGNTPLNLAAARSRNMEIIKELLERGADINKRSRPFFYDHGTPFDNAVRRSEDTTACLMIKIALLKNFEKRYREIIDLEPYKDCSNYSKLTSYLDDCVREILQIKTDEIKIYELITNTVRRRNKLCKYLSANREIDYCRHYPIYHDIILDNMKPYLERADLLNKLNKINIYTKLDNEDVKREKIILDYDCTYVITEYLSNEDLSNIIVAFDNSNKYITIQLNNHIEPGTRFDEVGTSNDAKRAKLE